MLFLFAVICKHSKVQLKFIAVMLLTPHMLSGMAVAVIVKNPILATPIAFLLHYLGDKVPHWDFYSHTKPEERVVGWRPIAVTAEVALGVAVGMAIISYVVYIKKDYFLAVRLVLCGIASVLPDLLSGAKMYLKNSNGLLELNDKIQTKMQFQAPLPWGIISQVIVSTFCLGVILHSIAL